MPLNKYVDHRGVFRQVSGPFFGKVGSAGAFKTPLRPIKAPGGTVWQLLYIRAKLGRVEQHL